MRTERELEIIGNCRRESSNSHSKVIMESRERREFLRFADGELVEYDLRRFNGKDVLLSREEIAEIDKFVS